MTEHTPVSRRRPAADGRPWTIGYLQILEPRLQAPSIVPPALTTGIRMPALSDLFVAPETDRLLSLRPEGVLEGATAVIEAAGSAIVLGDSGIGKSTLLRYVALTALRQEKLPFHIELGGTSQFLGDSRNFNGRSLLMGTLSSLIVNELLSLDIEVSKGEIENLLESRPVMLILDAVNELETERLRNALLSIIPAWQARWPKLQVICSSTNGIVDDGTLVIPHGMELLRLLPYGFERAGEFLDTFVAATLPGLNEDERGAVWQPTLKSLRPHPEVFGYPLYLAAIAVALVTKPDSRRANDLHSSYDVLRTLTKWVTEHVADSVDELSSDQITEFMAIISHKLVLEPKQSGLGVAIGIHDAARAIEDEGASAGMDQETVAALLRDIASRGGLFRRRWGDLIVPEFVRDFFASQYLAVRKGQVDPERAIDWLKASISRREVGGILGLLPQALLETGGTGPVTEFFEACVPIAKGLNLNAAADTVTALTRPLAGLRARGFAVETVSEQWSRYVEDLYTQIDSGSRADVTLSTRVSLATASALLTPPSGSDFTTQIIWFREPSPILLGSQDTDQSSPNYDSDRVPWERSVFEFAPRPFGLGKYPVTVAEYSEFSYDGYSDVRYWTPEGQAWLAHSGIQQPLDWEIQLAQPTTPVSGVSYYEALAYCAWITDHLQAARLPAEDQWEYAARVGAAGRFPWGDHINSGDSAEANWAGAGLRLKSPVGIFRPFNTVSGLSDMVGNVEEWCSDAWSAEASEYVNVGLAGKKVVRGGSCIRFRRLCRPAYRSRVLPDGRYHTLGFRVAFEV